MKAERKRLIVLIIAVILIVVIIKCIQGCDSTKNALKKKGYSKEDIITITEVLNKEEITKILELDHQEHLANIIKQTYYIPNNLFTYLEESKKNQDIEKVISLVNTNSYHDWYTNTKETDLNKGYSILVNKYNYLKEDFTLEDLVPVSTMYAYEGHSTRKEVYNQYIKMWREASKEELTLIINSSYRTYKKQQQEYDASNDDYAAKPGFSEHQTGLALDIVNGPINGNDFENTKEFAWLQENAHKYGFILRYPKDKEDITGYNYESWNYRYLGVEMATKVKNSGLTYDEYYAYYCDYKGEC